MEAIPIARTHNNERDDDDIPLQNNFSQTTTSYYYYYNNIYHLLFIFFFLQYIMHGRRRLVHPSPRPQVRPGISDRYKITTRTGVVPTAVV